MIALVLAACLAIGVEWTFQDAPARLTFHSTTYRDCDEFPSLAAMSLSLRGGYGSLVLRCDTGLYVDTAAGAHKASDAEIATFVRRWLNQLRAQMQAEARAVRP